MELILHQEDLTDAFKNLTIREVRYEHFRPEIRQAILAVSKSKQGRVPILFCDEQRRYRPVTPTTK